MPGRPELRLCHDESRMPEQAVAPGSSQKRRRHAARPAAHAAVARAALATEDDDVRAWVRLSLVCRAWRDSLRGEPHASWLATKALAL